MSALSAHVVPFQPADALGRKPRRRAPPRPLFRPPSLPSLHLDALSAARLNRGLRSPSRHLKKASVGCSQCGGRTLAAVALTRDGWLCPCSQKASNTRW